MKTVIPWGEDGPGNPLLPAPSPPGQQASKRCLLEVAELIQ